MSQDIYDNPIRKEIEAYSNHLDNNYTNAKNIMASKRKQMTSKVRAILEKHIAPKGWKSTKCLIRDTTECIDVIHNDGEPITLEKIELLTEEIVNLKLGSNGRKR